MKKLIAICIVAGLAFISSSAGATYWADFVYDYTGAPTPNFRGGIDVNGDGFIDPEDTLYTRGVNPDVTLGAPDQSYVSIYTNEFITLGFSTPFVNGPGDDFCVLETGGSGEGANIWVSSDGTNFTQIGIAYSGSSGSQGVGSYGHYNWFDLGSFDQPVSYVKVSDSVLGGSPGFDLSGVGAVYAIPEFYMLLESTEHIVSQIKGGFGKLPIELEQQFPAPLPDKDSTAGNYIFTSSGGLEGIIQTGELEGKPVPVLSQMSVLGSGQPVEIDYVSVIPIFGVIWDWGTKPRGPQDDPAQGDLRQRSILTSVNGVIRLNDFIGRTSLDLDIHFEFYGAARGYGLGTLQTTVTHGLMDGAMNVSGLKLADLFQKTVFRILSKATDYVLADGALSWDSRFRAKAEASVCFGGPINRCFDCPAITPDVTQTYLWQGGGISEINSGLIWQGVDFQVTVPTNQDIPLLFELMTAVETAGYAYGASGIERYRVEFTCPEIPGFGTHVIDSYDYFGLSSMASVEAANGFSKVTEELSEKQGISFRNLLYSAAGCEYLRTGLVSVKESLGGVQPPKSYPFAFVEGTEQSGLIFPVKVPRKPKKLVLLFDMFATHPVTPDEPIVVQFGLISTEEILLTKTIEASAFTYKPVPEPNGGYLVHTGWQEMVVDISDIPSCETMFCMAIDANQAPVNFGLAQSDLLIITEPALPGDFDADRIVNLTDYAMLASYWLEENCSYPDWCGTTDLDFTGRVDFAELGTIGSNWLRERIIGDFEPDGYVEFSDLMELAKYWLSAESSLDISPPGGDGKINFRDFAELAKHWLEGISH